MTVVPAGSLSLNEQLLRNTLAASATFQTLVGATSAAGALTNIHYEGLPPPAGDEYTDVELAEYHPFAFVSAAVPQGFQARADAVGIGKWFSQSGTLWVHLRRFVPSDLLVDKAQADLDWTNILGQIIDELCELAGRSEYLDFHTITLVGWWRNPRDEYATQGQIQAADIELAWGAV
jgi:hypothetical protein